jgi:hypothetical protein
MDIDWEKMGEFIKSVGIPFSLLLLFVAPIIYAVYNAIKTQAPKIVDKHNDFLERTAAASERNSDSIASMAATNAVVAIGHQCTHEAIKEIVRGARKAIDKVAPELAASVVPHLDRAEQAIERADR